MTTQLRIYEITPGQLDAFVEAWRASVAPLRIRFGFAIDGAWALHASSRFVWVARYDGPLSWEEAEERYYGSEERAALDPDPAQWIEGPGSEFADPVRL